MVMRAPIFERRIHARRCVCCGYDGDLLQNGEAERCARCGVDLRDRPARSYAEMEGFTADLGHDEEVVIEGVRPMLERWLAFSILVGACLLAIVYLLSAI